MTNMEERIKEQGDLVRKLKSQKAEKKKITEEVAKLKGLKEELGQDNEKKEAGKELTEESLNYCMVGNKVTDCGVLTECGHGIVFCDYVCAKNYSRARVRSEAGLGLEVTSSSSSSSSSSLSPPAVKFD